jgi:type I restriction enzyme S subunit
LTAEADADVYFSALLHQLLTAGTGESIETFELPEGWRRTTLAEVATIATGTTPSMRESAYYGSDGTPFIRPGMLNGAVIGSTDEFVSAVGLAKARTAPAGSVLTQCLGFGLGRVGVATTRVAFNQQINAATFNSEVMPEYGLLYLRHMGRWVESNATITLTPLLNKSRFSKMPFVLPPAEEQARIVARVERHFGAAETLEGTLREASGLADGLRRSILHRAATGRLSEQLDTDEPAADMLNRIQQAHAMASKKPVRKTKVA